MIIHHAVTKTLLTICLSCLYKGCSGIEMIVDKLSFNSFLKNIHISIIFVSDYNDETSTVFAWPTQLEHSFCVIRSWIFSYHIQAALHRFCSSFFVGSKSVYQYNWLFGATHFYSMFSLDVWTFWITAENIFWLRLLCVCDASGRQGGKFDSLGNHDKKETFKCLI